MATVCSFINRRLLAVPWRHVIATVLFYSHNIPKEYCRLTSQAYLLEQFSLWLLLGIDYLINAFGFNSLFIHYKMVIRRLLPINHIIPYPVTFKHCFQPNKAQNIYFSTSKRQSTYSDTVSNLNIGAHTRVIFQGFTGRQVCPGSLW